MKIKDRFNNCILEIIEKILKKKIQEYDIVKISGGFQAEALIFKTQYKNFFIKIHMSESLGLETIEKRLESMVTSHNMQFLDVNNLTSFGVYIIDKNGNILDINNLRESSIILHIQEAAPISKDYFLDLSGVSKRGINDYDISKTEKIVEYIAGIHKTKNLTKLSESSKKMLYELSTRSILTHPELSISMLIKDFPDDDPIIPIKIQIDILQRMFYLIKNYNKNYSRVSSLHGDFWGKNIFFDKNDKVWLVDYSRIKNGEPGIDIGWWVTQYIWFYSQTKSSVYLDLLDIFISCYIKNTGDVDILKFLGLSFGFTLLAYTNPRFYPKIRANKDSVIVFRDLIYKNIDYTKLKI